MAGKGQVRAMEDEVFSLEEHAESALEQHDIRQHSLIREEEEAEDEAPDDWALAEIFHDALALLPALTPTVIRAVFGAFGGLIVKSAVTSWFWWRFPDQTTASCAYCSPKSSSSSS